MTQKLKFSLKFKGERSYIHGTDIFFTLLAEVKTKNHGVISDIDMSIRKITDKNLYAIENINIENQNNLVASVRLQLASEPKKYFIYEQESSPKNRYPYDEKAIIEDTLFRIEEQSLFLSQKHDYSLIEIIVAMNKALLMRLFPNKSGKWFFTRIQTKLDLTNKEYKSVLIILEKNLDFKLTKSKIVVNDNDIGYIYFSLLNLDEEK